jgi:outer membrane protein assembly factor BamB
MKRIRSFALVGALALLAAGCNVNWAQFRADATHSGTQSETKIGTANAATLLPKWTTALGNAILGSPAIANGIAYVATYDGKVDALDALTGAIKWSDAPGSASGLSTPAVANGIVYVGSDNHDIYALDATTGAVDWAVVTGGTVNSSPTVVNGVVYVGSDDHKV